MLTYPRQGVGNANATNMVHPVAAAALPSESTGQPAAPWNKCAAAAVITVGDTYDHVEGIIY